MKWNSKISRVKLVVLLVSALLGWTILDAQTQRTHKKLDRTNKTEKTNPVKPKPKPKPKPEPKPKPGPKPEPRPKHKPKPKPEPESESKPDSKKWEYLSVGGEVGESVDLGLSVMWASQNVGASNPGDYGSYFAWGETKPKSSYTEENSRWYGVSYSELKSKGVIDGNGNLTSEYDAAAANWGGSWRMPTKEEIRELLDKCKWTWMSVDGHDGYRVTGPNGNSIFLPAAGYRRDDDLNFAGSDGYCWSSTAGSYEDSSYELRFDSSGRYLSYYSRYYGQSVRPVMTNPVFEGTEIKAVDMGLSVKWASHNIGAEKPIDYGSYFAWGETKPESSYTEKNCDSYELNIKKLKKKGVIDGNGNLTSEYDAATANWGGSWRMPTEKEMRELKNKCEWSWTSINGINGYLVTGPNGNSIFLPAAGYRRNDDLRNAGSYGVWWSSTAYSGEEYSYSLYFNSSRQGLGYNYRYDGQSVRPVTE